MLEVCVDSIESALNAASGNASRIELCSALSEGGLTPTIGTLKVLKEKLSIPIFVMVRPRRGNDFQYTDLELDSMLNDIQLFLEAGADGFVFGVLNKNNEIDISANKKLINACGDKPVTFHRAFDVTDPKQKLVNALLLANLGFSRILSSGFSLSALIGAHHLRELIEGQSKIIIMPGAGISSQNLEKILTETNCKEFHASARVQKVIEVNKSIAMGGSEQDLQPLMICSETLVRELVNIAKVFKN